MSSSSLVFILLSDKIQVEVSIANGRYIEDLGLDVKKAMDATVNVTKWYHARLAMVVSITVNPYTPVY